MTKENNYSPHNKELIGFVTSPNQGADLLEKYLGISFKEKPKSVVLSGRNKLLWAAKKGFVSELLVSLLRKDIAGFYDFEHNTYFSRENDDLFLSLHENMHAYLAGLNSEIPLHQLLLAKTLANCSMGLKGTPIEIEKTISIRCFDEGLAQWSAIEVATKLPDDFDIQDINVVTNLLLNGQESNQNIGIDEQFIAKEFELLTETKELYTHAIESIGITSVNNALRATKLESEVNYSLGYTFIFSAMQKLTAGGMRLGEAIEIMGMHPPTTFNELRNPEKYINLPLFQCI